MINTADLEFDKNMRGELSHLKHYALSLTMDIDDAKDLMQETVLKAYKYKSKFEAGTNLRGWLFTILKNTFINNYRKASKRRTFLDSTDNTFFIDTHAEKVENEAEMSFIRKDLETAIATLPEDLKMTFLMNAEGFKYHEIAEEFDIPLGTVKTRIFMARKILRSKLSSYGTLFGLHYTRGQI
jgi:RNA polymerase sigma factor (sigma-70 family)